MVDGIQISTASFHFGILNHGYAHRSPCHNITLYLCSLVWAQGTTLFACGVVWCGVAWCGVVWCGVVWCGVLWCGVVWCGVVWCGVVWCGVVWCAVVWCVKGAVTKWQWLGCLAYG